MEPIIDEALARRKAKGEEEEKSEDGHEEERDGTLLDHLVGQTQGLCFSFEVFSMILMWGTYDRSPDFER